MDEVLRAYLAGCMDGEGTYTIIARDDDIRCEPWTMLNQTYPQIPQLFRDTFGGQVQYVPPKPPRRNKYMWRATGPWAIKVCIATLPYLRLKAEQAQILIDLQEINQQQEYRSYAYWYEREHPDWREEQLLTVPEAKDALGFRNQGSLKLSIQRGLLLAIPGHSGKRIARIPLGQIEWLKGMNKGNFRQGVRLPKIPPQLVKMRLDLRARVKKLNERGYYVAS